MTEFTLVAPHVYSAIADVTAKLAKIGIGKDRNNAQQGYKFRGIDDVYNALSPLIADAGLCLLPRVTGRSVTERTTKNGGVLFYVVVEMDYDLVSAKDGTKHTIHVIGEAMDSGDKATNKAMSAAYKYMAMQVFCIPTEGDNDADATTHEVAAPYITAEQAADIEALITECGDAINRAGFLNYIKAESVETIRAADFKRAVAALQAKRRAAA